MSSLTTLISTLKRSPTTLTLIITLWQAEEEKLEARVKEEEDRPKMRRASSRAVVICPQSVGTLHDINHGEAIEKGAPNLP